jgi:hypothetical protein
LNQLTCQLSGFFLIYLGFAISHTGSEFTFKKIACAPLLVIIPCFGTQFLSSEGRLEKFFIYSLPLATALGVLLVALFGPPPLLFRPWSKNSEVIYHKKDCSPCVKRYCRKKPNCMELIEVEEVIRATDKLCKKARELSQIPSKLVI